MRRLALALGVLLGLSSVCYAAFAIFQTSIDNRTQVNITSAPYNATCNGIADDTAAFLAFKAAWQGTTPVQLNLPNGGNCMYAPTSGQPLWPFKGIADLRVSGYGATLTNSSASQPMLLGGSGTFFDNAHSVRTNTVSANASCVILKTQPSTSISAVTNSTTTATVTADINSAGVLNVTAISSGTVAVGQTIRGIGTVVGTDQTPPGTIVTSQLGGTPGGIGTYQLNITTLTLASQTFNGTGFVRLTVSSTAGYADLDNVFTQNVVGNTQLQNSTNGMYMAKVVDATHLDLMQVPFPTGGTYTSGGTVGGDRTSLFPVGAKVLMAGWVNQAYWSAPYGDPANPAWFDFRTVVSNNPTTHQVCFDQPLTADYKSTWPVYNTGDTFHSDPGGPATLYLLDDTWELNHDYRGFTTVSPNFQITAAGRNVSFTDVTFSGIHCTIPTTNETITFTNVDASGCNIEVDKIIGTINVVGGSVRLWKFQSAATKLLNMTNHTVISSMTGNPVKFVGNNVNFQDVTTSGFGWAPGAYAYGSSREASCTNCTITSAISTGGFTHAVPASMSFGGTGIITVPNWASYGLIETQTRALTPGSNFLLVNSTFGNGALGQVTDVTQDINNTYIQTTFTSGFPFTPTNIQTHPAPIFSCPGCTGSATALSLAQCTAGLPLWSCQSNTYTGGATGASPRGPRPVIWGNLQSIQFTTPVIYGGAGSLSANLTQFANWSMRRTSDNTVIFFGQAYSGGSPSINMKINGTRTLTQSSVTGAQSLDNLVAPGTQLWIGLQPPTGMNFSANTPSDSPQVTVKITTDQGVVP